MRVGTVASVHTGSLMDSDTTQPDEHPEPSEARGDEPIPTAVPSNFRTKVSTPLGWLALAVIVASAVLFTLPVANPGVQDCGAPAWFLLQAKVDRPLVTTNGKPINGWGKARLEKANAQRCSVRVSQRAVPAGILLAVFWVLALAALILTWSGRRSLRRRLRG